MHNPNDLMRPHFNYLYVVDALQKGFQITKKLVLLNGCDHLSQNDQS